MIEVVDLVRVLGTKKKAKRVIDGMSWTAQPGTVTGLLGPNGAGKTTTMRVLSTLLRPTEGTARVAGFDVVTDSHEVRRHIGLVTEEPGLVEQLTPRELLRFAGQAHGLAVTTVDARIDVLAEVLGCTEVLEKRCGTLSKGTRQKVALARALLHDPPVLLLDEPTAALDVVATAAIHDLLTRPEVAAGKTVLLASHSIDEVDRLAQRVVGIVAGRTVIEGTRDDVTAAEGAPTFREAFVSLLGRAALAASEAEKATANEEDGESDARKVGA